MSADAISAFLLEQDLSMSIGTRELPTPGADEVLIKVEWAGLCGSDLHVMRTGAWVVSWPATLGHEVYGRVVEAPEGTGLIGGEAVVVDSRIPCRTCPECTSGTPSRCHQIQFVGEARPGGFAERCVLPARMLTVVPDELEGSTAVLAEPLAVVLHALSHLVEEPRRAVILGHGPVGALVHAELRRRHPDAEVDVAEPASLRSSLARAFGGRAVASATDLPSAAYDLVVDASGYAGSLVDAIRLGAHTGQILLLGLGDHPVPVSPIDIVERRLRITGSNAFVSELPDAVGLLVREGWRYEPVVTDAIELGELPDTARRQLSAPNAVKVLVRP
jgi:2-desacetyl-2-hydroxyethyl bacteriochlorophyllide A dehydrogenase